MLCEHSDSCKINYFCSAQVLWRKKELTGFAPSFPAVCHSAGPQLQRWMKVFLWDLCAGGSIWAGCVLLSSLASCHASLSVTCLKSRLFSKGCPVTERILSLYQEDLRSDSLATGQKELPFSSPRGTVEVIRIRDAGSRLHNWLKIVCVWYPS